MSQAERGECDCGTEDECGWGVWGIERGLERVSAAAVVRYKVGPGSVSWIICGGRLW